MHADDSPGALDNAYYELASATEKYEDAVAETVALRALSEQQFELTSRQQAQIENLERSLQRGSETQRQLAADRDSMQSTIAALQNLSEQQFELTSRQEVQIEDLERSLQHSSEAQRQLAADRDALQSTIHALQDESERQIARLNEQREQILDLERSLQHGSEAQRRVAADRDAFQSKVHALDALSGQQAELTRRQGAHISDLERLRHHGLEAQRRLESDRDALRTEIGEEQHRYAMLKRTFLLASAQLESLCAERVSIEDYCHRMEAEVEEYRRRTVAIERIAHEFLSGFADEAGSVAAMTERRDAVSVLRDRIGSLIAQLNSIDREAVLKPPRRFAR